MSPPRARNKYGAKRAKVDGISFDSKREAAYYGQLKLRQRAGEVRWFIRQPSFDLPGGVRFKADFLVVEADGRVRVIDCKGFRTAMYRMKKKQVEALYPIEIEEQ